MRKITRLFAVAVLATAAASCGDVVRNGRSPVFLVMDSLLGARGGPSGGSASSVLTSDVITIVTTPLPCAVATPCPTTFVDTGTATFHLAPKNIGAPGTVTTPTTNNAVTLNQYHVAYRRADGHNVQGLDVPFAFDGAATVTVPPSGTASLGFVLVRATAKAESPLAQLASNPGIVTDIADVTFYGQDQVGNAISVTGSIQIDFGNFSD